MVIPLILIFCEIPLYVSFHYTIGTGVPFGCPVEYLSCLPCKELSTARGKEKWFAPIYRRLYQGKAAFTGVANNQG